MDFQAALGSLRAQGGRRGSATPPSLARRLRFASINYRQIPPSPSAIAPIAPAARSGVAAGQWRQRWRPAVSGGAPPRSRASPTVSGPSAAPRKPPRSPNYLYPLL
eukprot:Platyproteum_vivax@DN17011_c0_g1_i1.p1